MTCQATVAFRARWPIAPSELSRSFSPFLGLAARCGPGAFAGTTPGTANRLAQLTFKVKVCVAEPTEFLAVIARA